MRREPRPRAIGSLLTTADPAFRVGLQPCASKGPC